MGITSLKEKIDSLEKLNEFFRSLFPADYTGKVINEKAVAKLAEEIGPLDEDNFWVWREHLRVTSSSKHKAINKPVELPGFEFERLHYLHVSKDDPAMVAYTIGPDKGRRDLQTRTTIGRYIRKMFPETSDDAVRIASAAYTNKYVPPKLLFAKTADEMERVYEDAPFGSCMKVSHSYIKAKVHPVRAYASGDFVVAYFLNAEGLIAARSVCVPEDPDHPENGGKYVRIYGDADRMRVTLKDSGYTDSSSAYDGKRLIVIKNGDNHEQYVVPFLDGSFDSVQMRGDYWHIGDFGRGECVCASESSGVVNGDGSSNDDDDDDSAVCDHCGEGGNDPDNMSWSEHHQMSICPYCRDNRFEYAYVDETDQDYIRGNLTTYCEATGEYYFFSGGFSPSDVGLVSDEDGDLQKEDDCVLCVDEEYILRDRCTKVGVDADDNDIWVQDRLVGLPPEDFWRHNPSREIVHKNDAALTEWLEADERDASIYTDYATVLRERKQADAAIAAALSNPEKIEEAA